MVSKHQIFNTPVGGQRSDSGSSCATASMPKGARFESARMVKTEQYGAFFPNSRCIGVDLIEGLSVGLVCSGDTVDHADDTTISRESFEQNPNRAQTLDNRSRMAKRGGAVLFTFTTTGRPEKNPSQKPFRTFSRDLLESQI